MVKKDSDRWSWSVKDLVQGLEQTKYTLEYGWLVKWCTWKIPYSKITSNLWIVYITKFERRHSDASY